MHKVHNTKSIQGPLTSLIRHCIAMVCTRPSTINANPEFYLNAFLFQYHDALIQTVSLGTKHPFIETKNLQNPQPQSARNLLDSALVFSFFN